MFYIILIHFLFMEWSMKVWDNICTRSSPVAALWVKSNRLWCMLIWRRWCAVTSGISQCRYDWYTIKCTTLQHIPLLEYIQSLSFIQTILVQLEQGNAKGICVCWLDAPLEVRWSLNICDFTNCILVWQWLEKNSLLFFRCFCNGQLAVFLVFCFEITYCKWMQTYC